MWRRKMKKDKGLENIPSPFIFIKLQLITGYLPFLSRNYHRRKQRQQRENSHTGVAAAA